MPSDALLGDLYKGFVTLMTESLGGWCGRRYKLTRFKMAEMQTEYRLNKAFIDGDD
jgi:hypothetical protein